MMTKKSSDLSILLKKLTLIPLILSFVFLFSQKVIAQTTDGISSEEMKTYTKMMTKAKHKKNGTFIIHKETIGKLSYLYGKMSEAQQEVIEKQGLALPPPPPPPPPPAPRVYKDSPAAGNIPPPPPPPMSPYQYSKKMAKEGATFFYEGESISSEVALKILKNNEHINVSVSEKDGKVSVIKLSKAAIQIED